MPEDEARTLIVEALRSSGNIASLARAIGCHRSLLYQFARQGGSHLGPQVVSRMRGMPAFQHISSEAWLAAMGVVDVPPDGPVVPATRRGPRRR